MSSPLPPALGRPRSEAARTAVLHAVDDLLVEVGYAAMTMTGIAARAGVGKQTVYRWWSSKAEILLEATTHDAAGELRTPPGRSSAAELSAYASAVLAFLGSAHAGLAYRALLGEAQHDAKIAALLRDGDPLVASGRPVLQRVLDRGDLPASTDLDAAVTDFLGPLVYRVLIGIGDAADQPVRPYVTRYLAGARAKVSGSR
ncbi:TetR/AcrR family transcriptional regulator [Pimelobacter simplex]|uniref:TetR/AcrR family transcriptional regulator n=1 Tax=Nocardioides simplex TaxID=2045 RepID=UPI00214FD4F8|nr:TetR/AcrR family transcriptional regulator [Pimelobacter simplex]UUW90651.1 TetR/AcrR family transcriptional regulator [Pimelobacter simplex]UUW94480.1 TetR/AcrR family transcriptional regulator [Pimelobacter simplex]